MSKSKTESQVELEQTQVEVMEDRQDLRENIQVIEQAEHAKGNREIQVKYVQKYLDGKEYNLEQIAAEVNAHLGHTTHAFLAIGRLLLAVKKVEGHGHFLQWLVQNFEFSQRTAQNFMRVADMLDQRPDLSSLANGGISKALVLLDIPEDYKEEYVQEGTIDGKPLDEYHTMTRDELIAKVKKLKGDTDKIVDEETKAAKAENAALVEENKRLKKFEPVEDPTPEWVLERAQELNATALRMYSQCRQFMYDDRMQGDFQMQGKVEEHITAAMKEIMNLKLEWNQTFTLPEPE